MDIISGEKIQLRCDYIIGTKRDLDFNPKLKKIEASRKLVIDHINKPLKINSLAKIFCYSHLLLRNDFIEKMKFIQGPFELYLHNSDFNFTKKNLNLFNELKNLTCIYTQNMDTIHPQVHPLPIGIANEMWPHGNLSIFNKYVDLVNMKDFEKTNEIFFNFSVSTNRSKRDLCKKVIESKNIPWIQNTKKQENYLKNLSSYKFAICPEGNGIDTHRFWECLYLKVIPICKKNKLTTYFESYFPIVILNDWNELDVSTLNYDNYNWNKYLKLNLYTIIQDSYTNDHRNDHRNDHIIDENSTNYNDPEHESIFDIVIPIGPNDNEKIINQIPYTKKNVIGYRNIYLICFDPSVKIDGCITINENIFPFSIDTVARLHGKSWRNGWYLQQLLKLYAGFVIPDILNTYLVIDSDTFFMKPVTFIQDNKCCYNYGKENHRPYFQHMTRLEPSLKRVEPDKSGICHHMIFETEKLDKLFKLVEQRYENKKFYEIFLEKVEKKFHTNGSGASEYEIYFNYLLTYHPNEITIRKLNWKNAKGLDHKVDYVSVHWHLGFSNLDERQKMIDESEKKRQNVVRLL